MIGRYLCEVDLSVLEIRDEDFGWLVAEQMANSELAALAKLEYKHAIEFEESGQDSFSIEKGRLNLVNSIIRSHSFLQLSQFYKRSSDRVTLMKTFSAWKALQNYKNGGVFMDVSSNVPLQEL